MRLVVKARNQMTAVRLCNIITLLLIVTFQNILKQMKAVAAGIQLLTSADVAEALMREAGIIRDIKGNLIPPPEDSKQSARIAAISKLTDYTGDFDKNKNKVEHSGYVDRAESDLYDD